MCCVRRDVILDAKDHIAASIRAITTKMCWVFRMYQPEAWVHHVVVLGSLFGIRLSPT